MARIETVTETLRHALNVLANEDPRWLRAHARPEWLDRYGPRSSEYRLPKSKAKREAQALETDADGIALLEVVYAAGAPPELRSLPAVEVLRRVWGP